MNPLNETPQTRAPRSRPALWPRGTLQQCYQQPDEAPGGPSSSTSDRKNQCPTDRLSRQVGMSRLTH
jgi:hypothetical protein